MAGWAPVGASALHAQQAHQPRRAQRAQRAQQAHLDLRQHLAPLPPRLLLSAVRLLPAILSPPPVPTLSARGAASPSCTAPLSASSPRKASRKVGLHRPSPLPQLRKVWHQPAAGTGRSKQMTVAN